MSQFTFFQMIRRRRSGSKCSNIYRLRTVINSGDGSGKNLPEASYIASHNRWFRTFFLLILMIGKCKFLPKLQNVSPFQNFRYSSREKNVFKITVYESNFCIHETQPKTWPFTALCIIWFMPINTTLFFHVPCVCIICNPYSTPGTIRYIKWHQYSMKNNILSRNMWSSFN